MGLRHAYPPDLAAFVRERWPADHPLSLPDELLTKALAIAFQASLTSEESRQTRFRLLLMPVDALPEAGRPNRGVLRLRFAEDRPMTAEELRQLAPSAPFDAALIGAHAVEGRLRIWGLAHSGPAWLAPTWGGRSLVPNWTYDPIVHVNGPGRLAVRCAGKLVGGLERGTLVDAAIDVFESQWLRALFARERREVQELHAAEQALAPSPTAAAESLVGRVGQHMLRRAIQIVRGARHGGMILVVDRPGDFELPLDASFNLGLKYRFDASEPPRRYRTLLFQILDRLAAGTTSPQVDWSDYERTTNPELERLEQHVFEMSRVIASLAAIDGAVVLDKRFAILGFGAEVAGDPLAPARVWRATDLEGQQREPAALEDVGTRHRAAYRFVRRHPSGIAIVISQDGGVSFVANRDDEIVFWEQSVGP